jgi:hypothetical protein
MSPKRLKVRSQKRDCTLIAPSGPHTSDARVGHPRTFVKRRQARNEKWRCLRDTACAQYRLAGTRSGEAWASSSSNEVATPRQQRKLLDTKIAHSVWLGIYSGEDNKERRRGKRGISSQCASKRLNNRSQGCISQGPEIPRPSRAWDGGAPIEQSRR